MDQIIRQAVCKYAPQFVRRRIQLIYNPVEIKVLTDENGFRYLLSNRFYRTVLSITPQGSVTIMVTSDKILKITDTGIGIAPEDVPRIFEKGFTGYNGRLNKKSTGLGLYLCKKAADRLSHKISVESSPRNWNNDFY
ncbi:MAG: sensor histidine kinase [Lachnospiraceae bacterium]